MGSRKRSSRVWLWRQAIVRSQLSSGTRHTLQTLSNWMNSDGSSCYPSNRDIAKATGFDRKTVKRHLEIAESAGWVRISKAGLGGRRWKRDQYEARWPDERDDPRSGGGETRDCQRNKLVEKGAGRGGIVTPEVVERLHRVKRNVPDNIPGISPEVAAACEQEDRSQHQEADARFARFRAQHPTSAADDKEKVRSAFNACDESRQRAGVAMHSAWLKHLEELKRTYVPGGHVYWRDRLWEDLPQPYTSAAGQSGRVRVTPWSREWWADILYAAWQGDSRRVSYICTMLSEHGCGCSLDPGCTRDQRVSALSQRLDKVRVGDARWAGIERWFADRTGRSFPELPAGLAHVYVPNAEDCQSLKFTRKVADAGV